MTNDLPTRLLAEIEKRRQREMSRFTMRDFVTCPKCSATVEVTESQQIGGEHLVSLSCGQDDLPETQIVDLWEPAPNPEVLGFCQAHREIVEEYLAAAAHAEKLLADRAHGATYLEADGFARGLREALKRVARGYNLEEATE